MAMSDCPKCWYTPCMCGHEYESWPTEEIRKLAGILRNTLEQRTYDKWAKTGLLDQVTAEGLPHEWRSVTRPILAALGTTRSEEAYRLMDAQKVELTRRTLARMLENQKRYLDGETTDGDGYPFPAKDSAMGKYLRAFLTPIPERITTEGEK